MDIKLDSKNIKNIVFDVGGILLGYRWKEMFSDHGTDEETATIVGRGFFDSENWLLYDAGLIDTDELIKRFCADNPKYEEEGRWFIDNAILMRVPRPKVYEEISRLREKGYKIYLLSNYSEHLFKLHTADLPFRKMTDGELVSYMINEIKPNPPIYKELLERFNLNAKETLFFDDRIDNVEAANNAGMKGVHIIDASEELLLSYLNML